MDFEGWIIGAACAFGVLLLMAAVVVCAVGPFAVIAWAIVKVWGN